jgi:superfamily II DNA or RNA helicase
MHHLRPYQRRACLEAIQRLRDNPLVVAPTGAGKTTIGSYIVQAVPRRVVWLAHRQELIGQAAGRLRSHDIDPGVIKAGVPATPDARVQVASVQTLTRRGLMSELAGPLLIVVDEAHRSRAASYADIFDTYPHAARLGLTATPFRHDGKGLGPAYGCIVTAATTRELIDDGTLIEPDVYVVKPPDLSRVSTRGGEYAVAEAATATNTPEHRADIVEQWAKRCDGMRTLAFAVNVEHSKAIAEAFTAAGVAAEHVDGNTPTAEREDAIARLRDGSLSVLTNVDLFTEGFDLPAIEALIDAAPTQSLGKHLQRIGRVMRRADAKFTAVVHDHAGNHLRLGMVAQPLTYSLDDTDSVKRDSEPLGLRQCPECFRLVPSTAPQCLGCEYTFTAEDRELTPITGDAGMTRLVSEHTRREMLFDRLCEEQVGFEYKPGYVYAKFREETGEYPPVYVADDGSERYCNPETADAGVKRAFYRTILQTCIEKGWKPGAASHRYKELFGCWPKNFVSDVKKELGLEDDSVSAMQELMQ